MIFFGIDHADPRQRLALDSMQRNGGHVDIDIHIRDMKNYTDPPSYYQANFVQVSDDINSIKKKLDELEKTLSIFSDILKDITQR